MKLKIWTFFVHHIFFNVFAALKLTHWPLSLFWGFFVNSHTNFPCAIMSFAGFQTLKRKDIKIKNTGSETEPKN